MPAFATSATTIGLAKEVTRGTPVSPAFWAKVKSPKYKPELAVIADDTLQGSMVAVYNQTPGMRYDTHAWDGYPYMDVFPLYVLAELGSPDTVTTKPTNTTLAASAAAGANTISATGTVAANSWIVIGSGATLETHYTTAVSGAGPYTVTLQYPLLYAQANAAAVTGLTGHAFSLLNNAVSGGNQPPSLTITDFDGEEWRQLAAAQLDKLTLKGTNTGYVDFSCNFLSNASITPSAPSPSFSAAGAAPGWSTLVAIGGAQVLYLEDWQIDLGRGTKPVPALTGTQQFYQFFDGPLTATGKITVVEQTGSPELTKYEQGWQGAFDVTIADVASGYGMRMHSSNAAFKTGEVVRGKEWTEVTLDVQLLPTAADATAGGVSPINISIGNAQTTSY